MQGRRTQTQPGRLSTVNPHRLIRAAKTAVVLGEVFYDVLWRLFPDEVILISEESEDLLARVLIDAVDERLSPTK